MLLWDNAFFKTETAFKKFVPRQLLTTWGFSTLYFDLLINKTECDTNLPSTQRTQDSKDKTA